MKDYRIRNFLICSLLVLLISILTVAVFSCVSTPVPVPETKTPAKTIPTNSPETSSPTPIVPTTQILADTVIGVSIDQHNIKAGSAFTVNVLIQTQTALRGAQWKISFNPKVMRCDKITEGGFFKDWATAHGGETITFPKPAVDNATGQISDMGIAVMTSQEGGASGNGIVCSYYFTALADTIEVPILSNVQIVDQNAKAGKVLVKS